MGNNLFNKWSYENWMHTDKRERERGERERERERERWILSLH
jgi:hypothetical protein